MFKHAFTGRAILLSCLLVVMVWAIPIWLTPGMTGTYDWDWTMHRFEAFRRTVLEFHQDGRTVEPVYWSPNKILLEGLDPHLPLVVNLNPGSPWYNNGKQLFPQYSIVEQLKPFVVMPDEDGVVNLTYNYPRQGVGIIGTITLLIISAGVVSWCKIK